MAVAAIIASSVIVSDFLCMSRAHSRKGGRVHRQYTVGSQDFVQPDLQLLCLRFILLAGDLDSRLYLSNRNGRHEKLLCRRLPDPIEDGAMWSGTTQLRDHVGVEGVHSATPQPKAWCGDAVGAAA